MPRKKLALHQLAETLEAPAIVYRELAKMWLRKCFAAGKSYREYKLLGVDEVDLHFMDESNDGINHVYGFEGYEPPTLAFNRYVDGYIWCFIMNAKSSINGPFDTCQPLRDAAEYRKRYVPPESKDDLDAGDVLTQRERALLAALTQELSLEGFEKGKDDRIENIDFVVAEIEGRLHLSMTQIDKTRGFTSESVTNDTVDAEYLDSLLSEDEQETLLGEARRMPLGKTELDGIRGAYARSLAQMKRIMRIPAEKERLSGTYFLMRDSWVTLMRAHRISRPIKQTPKGGAKS